MPSYGRVSSRSDRGHRPSRGSEYARELAEHAQRRERERAYFERPQHSASSYVSEHEVRRMMQQSEREHRQRERELEQKHEMVKLRLERERLEKERLEVEQLKLKLQLQSQHQPNSSNIPRHSSSLSSAYTSADKASRSKIESSRGGRPRYLVKRFL